MKNKIEKMENGRHASDIVAAQMSADIGYIKKTLDMDFRPVLVDIKQTMSEIKPKVDDSAWWVDKWKRACYYIAIVAFGGGVVGGALLFFWKVVLP